MEIRIWFGAKPPMSHSILCTRLLWVAPSWTCCATTDLGDAMNAAPSSATPVTIPIMIRIKNQPSAGWGNRNRGNQVTANICVVLGNCTDTVVQLLSMPGQPAQSGRYVQCCCCCMISPNVMRIRRNPPRSRGITLRVRETVQKKSMQPLPTMMMKTVNGIQSPRRVDHSPPRKSESSRKNWMR